MASLDKFYRSLEQLRAGVSVNTTPSHGREKLHHLQVLADSLSSPSIKAVLDFGQYLSTSLELCLVYTNNVDSDIRMGAEEALNRIIRFNIEGQVVRIQIELYKMVKLNGDWRSVKAAAWRLGALLPLVPPPKQRLFVSNLIPCIGVLSTRKEEALQETLKLFVEDFCVSLGSLFTDQDCKSLLNMMLKENLYSTDPVTRRTAASVIRCVLVHARKDMFDFTVRSILQSILPIKLVDNDALNIGAMLAFKNILLALDSETCNKEPVVLVSLSLLLECALYLTESTCVPVLTASLESLAQFTKSIPKFMNCMILEKNMFKQLGYVQQYSSAFMADDEFSDSTSNSVLLTSDETVPLESAITNLAISPIVDRMVTDVAPEATFISTPLNVLDPLIAKSGDIRGNKLLEMDQVSASSESIQETVSIADDSGFENNLDIGHYVDSDQTFLEFLIRKVASRFLLTGEAKTLTSDRISRVSMKNLSLAIVSNCILNFSSIFTPSAFFDFQLSFNKSQLLNDIFLFATHSDPQIKAGIITISGTVLHTIISKLVCLDRVDELFRIISNGLEDESAITIKASVAIVSKLLPAFESSDFSDQYLQLVNYLIDLSSHKYWLVQTACFEAFVQIDYIKLVIHERRMNLHEGRLQTLIFNALLKNSSNEDTRVQKAACSTMVALVSKFYSPESSFRSCLVSLLGVDEWSKSGYLSRSLLIPIEERYPSFPFDNFLPSYNNRLLPKLLKTEKQIFTFISIVIYSVYSSRESNLQGLLLLTKRLIKHYSPLQFPHLWNIHLISASSSSIIKDFFKKNGYSANYFPDGGFISYLISLLSTTHILFDLSAHASVLKICTPLLLAAAKDHLNFSSNSDSRSCWNNISNTYISKLIHELTNHLLTILSIYYHIFSLKEFTIAQSNTTTSKQPQAKVPDVLPLLPITPTLTSTIKRKSQKFVDSALRKSPFPTNTETSDSKLYESKLTHEIIYNSTTIRLYETLNSMFISSMSTLNIFAKDKFNKLLSTCIVSIGQIFDLANLAEVDELIDDILKYMLACVKYCPGECIVTLDILFRSLFGTNMLNNSTLNLLPSRQLSLSDSRTPSFFFQCMTRTYTQFTQDLAGGTNAIKSQPKTKASVSTERLNMIHSHIRNFEPLVIQSLKLFTVTTSQKLQGKVLDLLCQLINLKVNYCLLDSDLVFKNFIVKQFENAIENGFRQFSDITGRIFYFLTLLSYEQKDSKPIIALTKINDLCSLLLSSDLALNQSLFALQPIAHDLFVVRGELKSDLDLDTKYQTDLFISFLTKFSNKIIVIELLTLALRHSQYDGDDSWKRLSVSFFEVVYKHLNSQNIEILSSWEIDVLNDFFSSLHFSLFHKFEPYLTLLFSNPLQDFSYASWCAKLLVAFKIISSKIREDTLLLKLKELKTKVFPSDVLIPEKPESAFALSILRCLLKLLEQLISDEFEPNNEYLKIVSQVLLFVSYYKKSDVFRKISSEMQLFFKGNSILRQEFDFDVICKKLYEHRKSYLTIVLQWSEILLLCEFVSPEWWSQIMPNSRTIESQISSPTDEFLTQSCFLLYCDHAIRNIVEVELLTWLLIDHTYKFIKYFNEPPVSEIFVQINQNSAASGLFMQALNHLFDNLEQHEISTKLAITVLNIIILLNEKQSISILTFLLTYFEKFDFTRSLFTIKRFGDILQTNILSAICDFDTLSDKDLNNLNSIKHSNEFFHFLSTFPNLRQSFCQFNENFNIDLFNIKSIKSVTSVENVIIDEEYIVKEVNEQLKDNNFSMKSFEEFCHQCKKNDKLCTVFLKLNSKLPLFYVYSVLSNRDSMPASFIELGKMSIFLYIDQLMNDLERTDLQKICIRNDIKYLVYCLSSSFYEIFTPDTVTLYSKFLLTLLTHSLKMVIKQFDYLFCLSLFQLIINVFNSVTEASKSNDITLDVVRLLSVLRNRKCEYDEFNYSDQVSLGDYDVVFKEITFCQELCNNQLTSFNKLLIKCFVAVCRHGKLAQISRIPMCIFDLGFSVDISSDEIILPQFSYFAEFDQLLDFSKRLMLVGWEDKHSFEEIWMIYLEALNLAPIEDESKEEKTERIKTIRQSLININSLILFASLAPIAGNATLSTYPYQSFATKRADKIKSTLQFSFTKSVIDIIGELQTSYVEDYSFLYPLDFFAVEDLRRLCSPSQSPSEFRGNQWNFVNSPDTNSCVMFLLEQFNQWICDSETSYSLLCETFRLLLYLSDFFTERTQYDWLYINLMTAYRSLSNEDNLLSMYIVPALCKSASVLAIYDDAFLLSIISSQLESPHKANQMAGLHAFLYILYGGDNDLIKMLLAPLTEFIQQNLQNTSCVQFSLLLLQTFFEILSRKFEALRDTDFISTSIQVLLMMLADNSCTTRLFISIMVGLEGLVISQSLNRRLVTGILKVTCEQILVCDTIRLPCALRLLVVALYSYTPPAAHSVAADPDCVVMAMEQVSAVFDRFNRSPSIIANKMCNVLSRLIIDYFPIQDRLNKTTMYFLHHSISNRLAMGFVVNQVFKDLLEQGCATTVNQWILLILPDFLSITPTGIALRNSCLLLLAALPGEIYSTMFQLVANMENVDNIFVHVSTQFFHALTNGEDQELFIQIFAQSDEYFKKIVSVLSSL